MSYITLNKQKITIDDINYNIINNDGLFKIIRLNDDKILLYKTNIIKYGIDNGILWYRKSLRGPQYFFDLHKNVNKSYSSRILDFIVETEKSIITSVINSVSRIITLIVFFFLMFIVPIFLKIF